MLTRSEFRQLFGLPKKRRAASSTKKTTTPKTKKVARKSATGKKVVRKPTAPKKIVKKSSVGKKVSRKASTKLGQKLIGGKLRTVYKSKAGAKYYKKVINGKTRRMYLGKPVRKVTSPRRNLFGYVGASSKCVTGLMGPFPLTGAGGSTKPAAPAAPAAPAVSAGSPAAFGKKRKAAPKTARKTVRKTSAGKKVTRRPKVARKTRFGYVNATCLPATFGPFPLGAANGSAIVTPKSAAFGKKRKAARKTVRKTPAKTAAKTVRKASAGKKVTRRPKVVRKTRFGMSHGRPRALATGPYPF